MNPTRRRRRLSSLRTATKLGWSLALGSGIAAQAAERFPFFEPVQPPRPFQVMAHRGAAAQAPENTRPALERCFEDGLEWAEVDVRRTRDGRHVIAHDDTLPAGGTPNWRVSEHTLDELRQLDLGSSFAARFAGERALSLSDCLALARHRFNLYLDCKAVDPESLAAAILLAGMERQVVVFDRLENLRRVHDASSGKVALMAKWHPTAGATDLEAWALSNHLAAVEIDAPEITPAIGQAFQKLGIRVQTKNLDAWDTPEFWDRSIDAGADWLQTDRPEEVVAHALWRRLKNRTRPVRFSLHRGANRYAPENTLPAFLKAIRLGADFVECDVRTTSDGRFYLLHDGTLNATTDATGPIVARTAAELETISAGVRFGRAFAHERLPTLNALLVALDGRMGLYLDAKAISPEAVAEHLVRHGFIERTVVYQSAEYLKRLKKIDPRIRALPPLRSADALDALADSLAPFGVDVDWDILSKDLIARCHARGIQVFSDALDSHERVEDYLQAIDWGIDVIQTDHPLRLLRAIELRAPEAPSSR